MLSPLVWFGWPYRHARFIASSRAEGESFQKIKDELRRDIAIHALTRTDTPLKQISIDVGFADQASFQRAFVQWTGRPPGAWCRMSVSDK